MIPVEFPPGVTNQTSKTAKTVSWREAHLIRWDGATMRPVGGWEKLKTPEFASRLRKMHRWTANDGRIWTAYLCEAHCYVEDTAGAFTDITPVDGMTPVPVNQGGYGNSTYGSLKYGVARPGDSRLALYAPIFSIDNWGEELRVMTSADKRYLGWSPSAAPGTLLTAVENAPVGNRMFLITPERHAMLFGMEGDPQKFGWSDEEDDTNWEFGDVLSRSRFYDVYPKTTITTQVLFDSGILMFTTGVSYIVEWVGLPYVYSYRPIGRISVPISPASICETPLGPMWPSIDGWWRFNGANAEPIQCPVWDWIRDNMHVGHTRFSGACVHLHNRGEVWWFFADKTSTGQNNRYAMYDYRHGIWSTGFLNRTCGYVYSNDDHPIMSDGTYVYRHETGWSYSGADYPWVESMNLNPNGGENFFTVNKILPDVSGNADALRWRMAKNNKRNGGTPETYSPQRSKKDDGWVDIRETARDMRLRIDMVAGADWGTIGPILFDGKLRGKK